MIDDPWARPDREGSPAADLPASGPPSDRAASDVGPGWEDRAKLGFWAALWRTWRDSVFRPVPFFRELPPRSGIGPALGYSVILTAVALFFSLYWGVLESVLGGAENAGELIAGAVVLFVFSLPLYIGFLFAGAVMVHVGFLAAGAGRQGFEGTFRALAYSAGPSAFAIFPFFGPILSLVWGPVLAFIAVREVQRTTNGRATLGFLMPFAAITLLLLLLAVILALVLQTAGLTDTL